MDQKCRDILDKIIPDTYKNRLHSGDVLRILKHIDGDIFGNECVIWKGPVSNLNNPKKGVYVKFFYRSKKLALHRILYHNLVSHIEKSAYMAYSCANSGRCLCLNHMRHKEKKIKNFYVNVERKSNKLMFKDNSFKIYFD